MHKTSTDRKSIRKSFTWKVIPNILKLEDVVVFIGFILVQCKHKFPLHGFLSSNGVFYFDFL